MICGMKQYLAIHSFPALQARIKERMIDYQLVSCTMSKNLKLGRREEGKKGRREFGNILGTFFPNDPYLVLRRAVNLSFG
jgi:hypothetical protein